MALHAIAGSGSGIDEPDWSAVFIGHTEEYPEGMGVEWREIAHRHWLRVTAELRSVETLASTNGHAIERLVVAYCRYDHAARLLLSRGAVLPSPRTQVPQHNLWRDEMRAADSDATTLEMELCLTPRRRNSAGKVKKQARAATSADRFLAAKA